MDDLLDMEETSDRTRTPVATLRFWRHQGRGPKSFKIGRRVMYRASDVDAWLQAQYDGSSAA